MKIRVKKTGVTFESGILDTGTVLDVSEKDGKRLISGGYAELVDDTPTEGTAPPEMESSKKGGRGKAAEK